MEEDSTNTMIKRNKGQVALTMSWFAAFIVIVLILAAYIVFASALAVRKVVPNLALDKIIGGETIDVYSSSLESQQKLFYLLNYPIGKGNFEDLLVKYNKDPNLGDNARENASLILESIVGEGDCFIFNLDGSLTRNKGFKIANRIFPDIMIKVPANNNGKGVGLYFGKC